MKILLPFIFLISTLLSTQAMAACNANIIITKPDGIYLDHSDGTVTDKQTGLMWQKCSLGLSDTNCATGTAVTFTWQAALAAANDNTDNGYSDWRLPNKNELESLVEDACSAPAINATVFPVTVSSLYWSSSPYAGVSYYAWDVSFSNGYVDYSVKDSSNYVRLVRGSQ